MVVDCHIHLYPEQVSHNPKTWAEARGETYWLNCVAPETGKSLQRWKSVGELIDDMDRAGVDKAVILGWYWQSHATCIENLDWQVEWITSFPDRLCALTPFHPSGGENSINFLLKAFESGAIGIGELNPPAQGYGYDDPLLLKALQLAEERGLSVNFHVTDPLSHEYPGKIDTDYSSLLSLAEQFPRLTFIFAHLGGLYPLRQKQPIPDNVYFDLAACPLLYSTDVYSDFCDTIGFEKILFGTDYPLKTFPRSKTSPDFSTDIRYFQDSRLSLTQQSHVLGDNARQILKI